MQMTSQLNYRSGPNLNEMTQLIFYDFSINEEINKHVEKTGFSQVGKSYNTIAIIGAQSTGKSTLLNKLFDTNFEVMTSKVGRGQTTKGVWAACHYDTKVFILDCEGTDSKERGEERHKFEHSSSLFCLAMADVLIINMWTNDVGRYTASNYGVLKIVFEMNLKLFQQECSKKILIVLRDFDPQRNLKAKIEELILKDIKNIWSDIKKPERYRDSQPKDFFQFEFVTLPHKKYCEEQFNEEINLMRKRLDTNSSDYLFSHVSSVKNVPADGIQQYVTQLWNDIKNEKELNIPSQKEMLSNYRCNEIKDQVLAENDSSVRDIINLSAKQNMDDFKERCQSVIDNVMREYDKTASNYVDKIYQNVRKQIEGNLSQKFYMCFANQAKRFIPISQKYMRQDLLKEIKTSNTYLFIIIGGDKFLEISERLKKGYLDSLLVKLNKKKVFENWIISKEEYEDIFDEIIDSQRKVCLEEKRNHTIKTLKKELDETLMLKIEIFKGNFWVDYNIDYFNYFAMKMFPLKKYLKDCYKMSNSEIFEFASYVEKEVYNSVKKDFSKRTKEISTIAQELFRKRFWYEKENEARNWNRLEDEEIDNLFKKHRAELAELFETLKIFKVCKNSLRYLKFDLEEIQDEQHQEILKQICDNIPQILDRENDNFEVLMRHNEISSMKRKFEDGITNILEDAKRRRGGLFSNNLPWWAWGLLIFFGFDDFLRWVTSFWIIPILLLIGTYFILNHLNLTYAVKNFYYDIEDKIMNIKRKILK